MPTYEYRCEQCDHEFEEFQSITAKPIRQCPQCGKNKVKRLIGKGAGVIFKGSGFYETDYRSDAYSQAAKADKEASSATTDTKTKSDTKESSNESSSSKTTETSTKPSKSTDTKSSSD